MEHVKQPLTFASFDQRNSAGMEKFNNFVTSYYPHLPTARDLWKRVLKYRKNELLNLCTLASLIISLSGSNSKAERTFSTVTNSLSDKRLSIKHTTLNERLIVYGSIIERALELYLKKRRTTRLITGHIPPTEEGDSTLAPEDDESEESDHDSEFDAFVEELDSSYYDLLASYFSCIYLFRICIHIFCSSNSICLNIKSARK